MSATVLYVQEALTFLISLPYGDGDNLLGGGFLYPHKGGLMFVSHQAEHSQPLLPTPNQEEVHRSQI
jgi:hypothetical protein